MKLKDKLKYIKDKYNTYQKWSVFVSMLATFIMTVFGTLCVAIPIFVSFVVVLILFLVGTFIINLFVSILIWEWEGFFKETWEFVRGQLGIPMIGFLLAISGTTINEIEKDKSVNDKK